MAVFWTRKRWRRSLVVAGLGGLGYASQIWADLTTHVDSRQWHAIALVATGVFYVAAIVGLIVVLRPDE